MFLHSDYDGDGGDVAPQPGMQLVFIALLAARRKLVVYIKLASNIGVCSYRVTVDDEEWDFQERLHKEAYFVSATTAF